MICGKKIFASQSEAKESIKGLKNDSSHFKSKRQPSYAYFCDDCNGWHMATEGKRREIERKQAPVNLESKKPNEYKLLHILNNCRIPIK